MFLNENNGISFNFETDETVLPPLAEWRADFEGGIQVTAYREVPGNSFRRSGRGVIHPRVHGAPEALAPKEMANRDLMMKNYSAWKRATLKVARTRLIQLLKAVTDEDIKPSQITFSAYAGCSCPCSPGFIVKGVVALGNGNSIWIETVKPAA